MSYDFPAASYDAWKTRSPDDERPDEEFAPELEEMDEDDWLEKQELEAMNTPLPDGMLEHDVDSGIRDLVRLYGFERAREMIAGFLIDELERRTIDVR